jgi:hypothetical protein
LAGARPERLIAVLGESQVGKSTLVNSLLGVDLLPTFGKGSTCTQTVCEIGWSREPLGNWRLGLEWAAGEPAWRSLPETQRAFVATALSENMLSERQARAHIKFLVEIWSEGVVAKVRVSPPEYDLVLVDLPGFGHDDAGGVAADRWLARNADSVAAVLCVHGMRSPEVLGGVLRKFWTREELLMRLYGVATWADGHSRQPGSSVELALRERRLLAAHWIARMTDRAADSSSIEAVYSRTFCCDPRPDDEFVRGRVEFVGELDRLRATLASVTVPAPRNPSAGAHLLAQLDKTGPGALEGESVKGWLARVVGPRLRQAEWDIEPGKGRGVRHVLLARNSGGNLVRFITISGSGAAWLKLADPMEEIVLPSSDLEARVLRDKLLKIAGRFEIEC